MNKIVFLCGARDYHAMDWYSNAKYLIRNYKPIILTDLIQGEGFKKLVTEEDKIDNLLIIDRLLFSKQSKIGNIWRNFIKLLVLPIQVQILKKHNKNSNHIYWAHSMYYLWLAYFAGVDYIGTPQGSDILIKPYRSKLYKFLSVKALKGALHITVDSEKMSKKCLELSSRTALIIQNGINIKLIKETLENGTEPESLKNNILSIRGLTPLYRIDLLSKQRDFDSKDEGITFIYPFCDETYKNNLKFHEKDIDLGRVDRVKMYRLMASHKLVISIPSSDSSPRSVYESIFCGAIVAIDYNSYIQNLPRSMRDRIIVVDLNDPFWLSNALKSAKTMHEQKFIPCQEASNNFDQLESLKKVLKLVL